MYSSPYIAAIRPWSIHRHTKVGITKDSFIARENGYKATFDGEVEFVPIAEIAVDRLEELERAILNKVSNQYGKVGRAREWFDTDDRKSLISLINGLVEGYR